MGVAFTRRRIDDTSTLRQGLVGAWCPSLPNGGSGNMLPDVSGYNSHGSLVNMSPDDWVSSQYGRALGFDGVDDRVSTNLTSGTITTFSCSVWVRQIALSINKQIFGWWDGSSGLFAQTGYNDSSKILFLAGTGSNFAETPSGSFSSNQITHLIFTYNGPASSLADKMSIFINGVSQSLSYFSGVLASSVNTGASTFSIGYASISPRFWNGALDDIRIYNRVLSPSEIRLLASRPGIGLQNPQDDYIYYPFPSGSRRRRLLTGMP